MDALRRNEIIRLWKLNEKYLNYFCCPDCRDILEREDDVLMCANNFCENTNMFNIKTGEAL